VGNFCEEIHKLIRKRIRIALKSGVDRRGMIKADWTAITKKLQAMRRWRTHTVNKHCITRLKPQNSKPSITGNR
jgi:hypothetical protein